MKIYKNLQLEDLDGEIWKYIDGYNQDYQISNLGRVKSFKKYNGTDERILNLCKNKYLFTRLYKNGKVKKKYIHVLMFESFNNCKLKENEIIHHIDENSLNNILDNFKLMTKFEHRRLHMKGKNNPNFGKNFSGENSPMFGKHHSKETKKLISENHVDFSGENHPRSKLTEQDIINIRKLCNEGVLTQKEIANLFNVHKSTISNIKNNRNWKHIKEIYYE